MKLKPAYDCIVIKRREKDEETSGGLIIPETSRTPAFFSTVLAIGHGRLMPDGTLIDLIVTPGDIVLTSEYAGQPFTIDGEEVYIIREDEILGVYPSD